MRMAETVLAVTTGGQGFHEITGEVAAWLRESGIRQGLLTLFVRHTSASLLVQENAAPEVRDDLLAFLRRIAPEERGLYRHDDEGPDDMPAHIRSALLPTQLSIPVSAARLVLGTWQGVYLVEHRRAAHRRDVVLQLMGE